MYSTYVCRVCRYSVQSGARASSRVSVLFAFWPVALVLCEDGVAGTEAVRKRRKKKGTKTLELFFFSFFFLFFFFSPIDLL